MQPKEEPRETTKQIGLRKKGTKLTYSNR